MYPFSCVLWDEFLRRFRFCDEEDSGLSDEGQKRKGSKNMISYRYLLIFTSFP